MATKKINGLCASFNRLYKGTVSMIDATRTQRTYATVDEGDTQVTHTGQVRYSLLKVKYCVEIILLV